MNANKALKPVGNVELDEALTDAAGQLSARSKRVYASDARMFAVWIQEQGLSPQTLTRSHIIQYRAHLAEHYAKATASRMLTVARRLLQEQVNSERRDRNPASGVKGWKRDDDETPHTALTKQQAKDLLALPNQNTAKGKRDFALLKLLIHTGLRREECASLCIGDITMEQGHHIAIVRHGKGDKRAIVKLPVDVFRAIHEYLAACNRLNASPEAPLFVGFDRGDHATDRGVTAKTIERLVKSAGAAIGVPTLTPHGLRASFITLALENGASLHQVQYAARHADPRTTERYQKRKLNLDDNAVDYIKL